MLKYPCLVLDHDDTVVQSEKTLGFPFFQKTMAQIRPHIPITYEEYVRGCHEYPFADMCRIKWGFTEEELRMEHEGWKEYVRTHVPDPFPGVERIIHRQKEAGGLVCVVSLSGEENICRDYMQHFGVLPDAVYGWDLPIHQQKPSPYPLLDIMERFSLTPDQMLVVDDLKLAWKMSKAVDVPIAFAAWGKTDFPELSEEMRTICDLSFDSIDALEKYLFGS